MTNDGCWLFVLCHFAQKISKSCCDAGASTLTHQGNNQSLEENRLKTHTNTQTCDNFFLEGKTAHCFTCISMHYMDWGEDTHTLIHVCINSHNMMTVSLAENIDHITVSPTPK